MYRDETSGKLILVPRDTNPQSLVDWQTNTRNGQGMDTKQYKQARELARTLSKKGVNFDLAGYSKGGGLAQEMELISPSSHAFVFNSAGLPDDSAARTGAKNFDSLAQRTRAFSAEHDFLTFMNRTTDPERQVANARFLRRELQGDGKWGEPMKLAIGFRNPANPDGESDPEFETAKRDYMVELDTFITDLEAKRVSGQAFRSFPPVRAAQQEEIPNSVASLSNAWGMNVDGPNASLGKLNQHLMDNVLQPMKRNIDDDRKALKQFMRQCR